MQRECPSFYNGGRVEAKLQGRQLNKKRNKSAGDFPVFVRTPAVLAPVLFLLRPLLPPPPPSSSHLGARLRTPARFQKSHPCPIAVEQTFFFPLLEERVALRPILRHCGLGSPFYHVGQSILTVVVVVIVVVVVSSSRFANAASLSRRPLVLSLEQGVQVSPRILVPGRQLALPPPLHLSPLAPIDDAAPPRPP